MTRAEEIRDRLDSIAQSKYGLECADGFLFSNRSGNRPLYESWEREEKELREELKGLENE